MDMTELTIKTDDLLTCNQAARILGVSRPTVYNMIERYQLHPVLIGRNRYLLRGEIEGLKTTKDS
jgi:excisionase family DNA binding protein